MQKRTIKVAILAALAVILMLSFSSVALADQTWSDLPDTVTAKYAITDNQVAAISDGFAGGLWKPYQAVTRAQFTKMAVMAFGVNMANPATASYSDVPKTNIYFQYIEGAKAAGIVNGLTATTFGPNTNITRQQAIAIVARFVATANGYNLATMYTSDQIAALLAHFGDAASISADLKDEVAFAYDMGLTKGDAYGNVAPLANLTRIQGAAFLIRAQGLVPPAQWTAAAIELVSEDKSENLIGQVHKATFKVTDAAGHPAKGVLVDFDVLTGGPFEVGNISNEAAVTNNMGEVTVDLISTEPGTQRVSAAVAGLAAIYTTKYWLVLDEVYITDETRMAENNAGESHTWGARVVVFGPGPRSTSVQDWYNAIDADFDPADIDEEDGVDWGDFNATAATEVQVQKLESWCYGTELAMIAAGWMPRTLAGITVEWSIVDSGVWAADDEDSVGNIIKVDGASITPAQTANGTTDDEGFSSIVITSTVTGNTWVQAVATYAGNPYPKELFNHSTFQDGWNHNIDWDDQPALFATAMKIWIPHVIGGDSDAPITPLYAVNNTGEVETFVLDLEDVYGNPIPGYTVEWWIQGVGFFKTDGSTWVGIGEQNKDIDVTDAAGQAAVSLKSLIPGQTIVHLKVMDKYGLPWKEWNVVKQWYSIDRVEFIDAVVEPENALQAAGARPKHPESVVDTGHSFTAQVSGAKYVYSLYDINQNGLRDDAVLIGNREDMKAASGVILAMDGSIAAEKSAGVDVLPGQVFRAAMSDGFGSVNAAQEQHALSIAAYTRFADFLLQENEFWSDGATRNEMPAPVYLKAAEIANGDGAVKGMSDGIREVWAGLEGKNVYFFSNVYEFLLGGQTENCVDWTTGTWHDTPLEPLLGPGFPLYVGSITSDTEAVTDAMGMATVDINSLNKGYQFVFAVADYTDNPQDGDPLKPTQWAELRWDAAAHLWLPDVADPGKTTVWGQRSPGADPVVGDRWVNPVLPGDRVDGLIRPPSTETIAVQVFDTYGNALEGYKVTWEIVGQGTTTAGSEPTYHPFAHFDDDPAHGAAGVGDLNPWVNSNKWWGDFSDGVHPQSAPDDGDWDYAWGYTENHLIDFELDRVSAAYVDLVLDETRGELDARAEDHFTNIVNIKVYYPVSEGGGLFDEFEVTKVWSLDAPVITSVVLEQAAGVATAGFTKEAITIGTVSSDITYQVTFLDQFGNPIPGFDPSTSDFDLLLDSEVPGSDRIIDWDWGADPSGSVRVSFNLAPGFVTATLWEDLNGNNAIDATEMKSNSVVANVVINPGG